MNVPALDWTSFYRISHIFQSPAAKTVVLFSLGEGTFTHLFGSGTWAFAMSWLCLFSLSVWAVTISYNLSFWSKHRNGHAETALWTVLLFSLSAYHPVSHFYTLITLRRLSKSHQSLNKLSHLYREVTDDRPSAPARQTVQSSWWKAAHNPRYRRHTGNLAALWAAP